MNPNPVDLKKSEEYRRIHERLTLSPTRKPTTITRDRDLGYRDDLDVLSEHAALASKKREEGGDLTENEDDIIETTNEKISQRSIERSAVKSTLKPVFGGVRRVGNEILKKMEQIRSITNELETETAAHKITQKRKDDLHAELLAAEKFIEQKNVEIKLLKSMLEATKNTSSLPAQTMVAIGVDNMKSGLDETSDRVSEMESKIKQQLQKFKPATVAEAEQPVAQQTEPTQNLTKSKYKPGTKGMWSINGTDMPITLSGKQVITDDGSIMLVTLTENGLGAAIYEKDFSVSAEPLVNETKPDTRKQERIAEVEEKKRSETLAEAKSVAQVAAKQIATLKQSGKNFAEFAQKWATKAIEKIESLDIDENDRLKLIQQIEDALGTKKKPEPKDKVYGDAKERRAKSEAAAAEFAESRTKAGQEKKAKEEESKKSKEMQSKAKVGLAALVTGASLALGATYAKQESKDVGIEQAFPITAKRVESEMGGSVEKLENITVDYKSKTALFEEGKVKTLIKFENLNRVNNYYFGVAKFGDQEKNILIPSRQIMAQLKVAKSEEERHSIASTYADQVISNNPNLKGVTFLTGQIVYKNVGHERVPTLEAYSFKRQSGEIMPARNNSVEIEYNQLAKNIFGEKYPEYVKRFKDLTLAQFRKTSYEDIKDVREEVNKVGGILAKYVKQGGYEAQTIDELLTLSSKS